MLIQIRQGVFETNSSSTHSLCITTEEEYNNWEKDLGIYYDCYNQQLLTTEEVKEILIQKKYIINSDEDLIEILKDLDRFYCFEEYKDNYSDYYEVFKKYTTKSGEKIVAFSYHGYNG